MSDPVSPGKHLASEAFKASQPERRTQKEEVYENLLRYQPISARDLALKMERDEGRNVRSRLLELKKEGRAARIRIEVNKTSKKRAFVWIAIEPGKEIPETIPERPSRKALEAEIVALKNKIQALTLHSAPQSSSGTLPL